ncbi:MAG: gfo/Idh/MocA family oxidoreductase, partial [Sphingomonadales bacterium]
MDRRSILTGGAFAGLATGLPATLLAQSATQGNAAPSEIAPAGPDPTARHRIRFAAIGMDHAHIYSMCDAIIRGGGTLKWFYSADPAQVEAFGKRYPAARLARSEAEILDDKDVALVLGAP